MVYRAAPFVIDHRRKDLPAQEIPKSQWPSA